MLLIFLSVWHVKDAFDASNSIKAISLRSSFRRFFYIRFEVWINYIGRWQYVVIIAKLYVATFSIILTLCLPLISKRAFSWFVNISSLLKYSKLFMQKCFLFLLCFITHKPIRGINVNIVWFIPMKCIFIT